MVDETSTGLGDAPKDSSNPVFPSAGAAPPIQQTPVSDNAPIDDVHILEETITKPHAVPASEVPKIPQPPATVVTKPASPSVLPPPIIAAPLPPLPPLAPIKPIANPPLALQVPNPVVSNPTPIFTPPPRPPSPEIPKIPDPISTAPTPQTPATPQQSQEVPPVNAVADTPAASEVKGEITQILKGIQLPERRDIASTAPTKKYEVKTFDTVLGADVTSEQEKKRDEAFAAKPPEPAIEASVKNVQDPNVYTPPEADTQTKSVVVSMHTLKDDLQHVVHDKKMSLVRAISLEEKRKHREGHSDEDSETTTPRSRPSFGILFGAFLLIFLGGGALLGVYTVEKARSNSGTTPVTSSSILFAENSVTFPLDNRSPSALKQLLAQARTSSGSALGSITQILPTLSTTASNGNVTARAATFSEFMNALGANPPPDLIRALSSDFFFGIHTVDKNAPLLVIPVVSYDHAFAAMLTWEPALNADLSPVFSGVSAQTTDSAGLPIMRSFSDLVMRNYDVRALKDDSGQVVMYYSFPTRNVLIIAESPYTFTEVLSRLQAQRKL